MALPNKPSGTIEQHHAINTLLVSVATFVVGFALLTFNSYYKINTENKALKKELALLSKQLPQRPAELSRIEGKIISRIDNKIFLETHVFDPLGKIPSLRNIYIGKDTRVFQKVAKRPEALTAENKKYSEELLRQGNGKPPKAPLSYIEKNLSTKDIEIGMSVAVSGKPGENLINEEHISAWSIEVLSANPANPQGVDLRSIPPETKITL